MHNTDITIGNIIRNLFFINDLFPDYSIVPGGWSISTEMIFYLIVPALFTRIKNLNSAVWFSIISFSIAMLWTAIIHNFTLGLNPHFLNTLSFPLFLPYSVPVFGIGISFYFIIFKNDTSIQPYLLLAVAGLLIIAILFESGEILLYFITIAFGVIALALSKKPYPLFVNGIITFFGKISYSMYMTHFIVISLIENTGILKKLPVHNNVELIIYFA